MSMICTPTKVILIFIICVTTESHVYVHGLCFPLMSCLISMGYITAREQSGVHGSCSRGHVDAFACVIAEDQDAVHNLCCNRGLF